MATLRLFGPAREAAGTSQTEITATTTGELLTIATAQFGADFAAIVERSRVWVNGETARDDHPLLASDEVAVLPPVSGG